jgi:hypothetical protein
MHEYLKRQLLAADAILALRPDGVMETTVLHDDDCGVYKGHECNCDPDITFTTNGHSYSILKDGSLKKNN